MGDEQGDGGLDWDAGRIATDVLGEVPAPSNDGDPPEADVSAPTTVDGAPSEEFGPDRSISGNPPVAPPEPEVASGNGHPSEPTHAAAAPAANWAAGASAPPLAVDAPPPSPTTAAPPPPAA